jgi:DNA-directed RNA polymerase specialized sigma24 family protein
VGTQRPDFSEFYRETKNECLFAVLVSVGDPDTAQDLVAEAFARALASWAYGQQAPGPGGVGGAYGAEHRCLAVAAAPP